MHLADVVRMLFILLPLLSCDKSQELYPSQCNCDIEALRISEPSLVTYQVAAYENASVSTITYKTSKGKVTIEPESLPFETTIQLDKGDTIALTAVGNPKKGSIILGYEIKEKDRPDPNSSTASRVWILKDGTCQ
ncbi:hypothetical protein [Parapedobacter defluvii]|uniref:hypothetical protein n=1 Tax=Parapedobacter defluvii TaxID=2045106 RepID=UPI000F9587F6|nr:MAG: hypothetical protein EAS52_17900 [Parapedobacter sp.]